MWQLSRTIVGIPYTINLVVITVSPRAFLVLMALLDMAPSSNRVWMVGCVPC